MSCVVAKPTFRLLDGHVGWDIDVKKGMAVDGGELTLERPPGASRPADLLPYLPPPWVAVGCDCDVWLTAAGLWRLGPCGPCFEPFWMGRSGPPPKLVAVDISVDHRIAVAAQRELFVLDASTRQLVVAFPVPAEVRDVAWTSRGMIWVATADELFLYSQDGDRHAQLAVSGSSSIRRVGVGASPELPPPGEALWIFVEGSTSGELYRFDGKRFEPADPAGLGAAFDERQPTIASAWDDGFCLVDPQGVRTCWDRDGCPTQRPPPTSPTLERKGQVLTQAIDSGIPRCRWHRVRADALVPPGTQIEIAVATAERIGSKRGPIASGSFAGFESGVPHPLDWQAEHFKLEDGVLDFLVDQPPGRYLFVRLRMASDSERSPRLRELRLDFPRVTSLQHLPAIYSEAEDAHGFTARFLSLFDATIEDFDEAVERMPALLDAGHTPAIVLPWLAERLGIPLEAAYSTAQRRNLVQAAARLMQKRGTPDGLRLALRLALGPFDVGDPVVSEPALERPWGALGGSGCCGTAVLGSSRLFGRSAARLRLGTSILGKAPINSLGDPAHDADDAIRGRISIALPPVPGIAPDVLAARAERIVDRDKPVHTLATVHVGGRGYVVGTQARVGIDTLTVGSPPGVLGEQGNIRLGRSGPLRGRRGSGLRLGASRAGGGTPLDC